MAETLYTICNIAILPAWVLLIVAPRWKWTPALTGLLPVLLALFYTALVVGNLGSFRSFAHLEDVSRLFENPYCLLIGWVHFLAFDLLVGGWEVRDAQRSGVPHWLVVPCLILTLLLAPAGFLCYLAVRACITRRLTLETPAAVRNPAL